jgi:hypothetical protein
MHYNEDGIDFYHFVHVPKVAGMSMHHLLGMDDGICENGRISYCGHIPRKGMKYFAFIRNPYDRLIDAYFYLTKDGVTRTFPDDMYCDTLKAYKDFNDFSMHLVEDEITKRILHMFPMWYWLCDKDKNIMIDTIFKIEEIDKIDEFLVQRGFPKLSDVKINIIETEPHTNYLNKDNIKIINEAYDDDFRLFNYEKL